MKTTIYLVRHGEYENPKHLFPGRLSGFPLSARGIMQAERLGKYFHNKHITGLFSSPLLRTKQTAVIIGKNLHLPVIYDDRLLETVTLLDGESMQMFDDTDGGLSYMPDLHAKGAESMDEEAQRMKEFIEEIVRKYTGQSVIAVTHGDPMRYVVMKYRKMPIDFSLSRSVAIPLGGGYALRFSSQGDFLGDTLVVPD